MPTLHFATHFIPLIGRHSPRNLPRTNDLLMHNASDCVLVQILFMRCCVRAPLWKTANRCLKQWEKIKQGRTPVPSNSDVKPCVTVQNQVLPLSLASCICNSTSFCVSLKGRRSRTSRLMKNAVRLIYNTYWYPKIWWRSHKKLIKGPNNCFFSFGS